MDRSTTPCTEPVAKTLATLAAGLGALALARLRRRRVRGQSIRLCRPFRFRQQKEDPRMTERAPLHHPAEHQPPSAAWVARDREGRLAARFRRRPQTGGRRQGGGGEAAGDQARSHQSLLRQGDFARQNVQQEGRRGGRKWRCRSRMPPTRRRRTRRARKPRRRREKAIDHTLNAPTVAPENDPFHPQPPKSYDGMSNSTRQQRQLLIALPILPNRNAGAGRIGLKNRLASRTWGNGGRAKLSFSCNLGPSSPVRHDGDFDARPTLRARPT